jgi:hypothetical protein
VRELNVAAVPARLLLDLPLSTPRLALLLSRAALRFGYREV